MDASRLRCIRCGARHKRAENPPWPAGDRPRGALLFYSRGSNDSAVYSPDASRADIEHLVISVCDECLLYAGARGDVAHGLLDAPPGTPLPGEWLYSGWRVPGTGSGIGDDDDELDGFAGEITWRDRRRNA